MGYSIDELIDLIRLKDKHHDYYVTKLEELLTEKGYL